MIAFGNRWWALPKVFPEKWSLLEACIKQMTKPGPFIIEGVAAGREYVQVSGEVLSMARMLADHGEGIFTFKCVLQALLRPESDLVALGSEKRLEETSSCSLISKFLADRKLPRDEDVLYNASADMAPLHTEQVEPTRKVAQAAPAQPQAHLAPATPPPSPCTSPTSRPTPQTKSFVPSSLSALDSKLCA